MRHDLEDTQGRTLGDRANAPGPTVVVVVTRLPAPSVDMFRPIDAEELAI